MSYKLHRNLMFSSLGVVFAVVIAVFLLTFSLDYAA